MELGLYYYNARYYAPGLGRFISADTIVPDPTNPQSLNRYTYVLNSPLKFIDPSGHCLITPDGGQDSTDQDCWDQFFSLYSYLQDNGITDSSGSILGAGKDWQFVSSTANLQTKEGTQLEWMDFLMMRKQLIDEQGAFCESIGCIEDAYWGTGESSKMLESEHAPAVCGTLASFNLGTGGACVALGYLDYIINCSENGPDACLLGIIFGEIGGSLFDAAAQPFQEGLARTVGSLASEWIDLGGPLSVMDEGVQTVHAPDVCLYSTCNTEITFFLSNRP